MFSKLKRLRSKSCKVQLILELQELKIFDDRTDLTLICIELRRGSKSISSSSKICRDDGSKSVKFDEQLLLLMTLYKDSSGIYMQKIGKLVLNGHSNITNSTVSIGSTELKLNVIASNFEHQDLDFILLDGTGQVVASISAVSSSKFLGNGDLDNDEGSSNVSGCSGLSSKSHSHFKDVRYGSVYNQDYAGRVNPEVSGMTTDKLRSSILKTNTENFTHNAEDTDTSINGNGKREKGSSRKSKNSDSSKHDEGIIPRSKLSGAYGPKDIEVADLRRELEQANLRATVAQQEQRNIQAVLVADAQRHEDIVNELNGKIVDATNEIEELKSTIICESSPIQSEADNAKTTNEIATDDAVKDSECDIALLAAAAAAAELAEVRESCRVLKDELEQKEIEIKTLNGKTNALNSDLNAVSVAESDLRNEKAEMTARLTVSHHSQELMAADTAVMRSDLTEARGKYSTLEEKCSAQDKELSEERTEHGQLKDEMHELQRQHVELESLCAHQKSVIADNERNRAISVADGVVEADVLKELRVQLTIKKLSEDSVFLGEIKELEDEVARLSNVDERNEQLLLSLSEAKGRISRLITEKEDITGHHLASSERLIESHCADISKLEEVILDIYKEMLNIHTEHGFIEKIQNRMTAANIGWEVITYNKGDFLHLIEWDSSSTSSPVPNTAEEGNDIADIDRLIMESDEALLRVKEKRGEFKQSRQSKRVALDKLGSGKERGLSRKRGAPLEHAMRNELKEDLFKSDHDPIVEEVPGDVRAFSRGVTRTDSDEHNPFRLHCVGAAHCSAFDRSMLEMQNSAHLIAEEKERECASDGPHDDPSRSSGRGDLSGLVERSNITEVSAAAEKQKFENRTKLLLKSLGMFNDAYSNFMACTDQTDEKWEEAVRIHSDAERKKMMTLKSCLMRFSSKLTPDELYDLEDFGIFLAPRGGQRNSGLRLGSALCFV